MTNEDGFNLEDRTAVFGERIIAFAKRVPINPVNSPLISQLVRAGTSIGANLAEASAGQTKPDFIAKTCVSLKEAREARYWLLLIIATRGALQPAAQPLLEEARELVKILTTIVKNARSNPPPRVCAVARRYAASFVGR